MNSTAAPRSSQPGWTLSWTTTWFWTAELTAHPSSARLPWLAATGLMAAAAAATHPSWPWGWPLRPNAALGHNWAVTASQEAKGAVHTVNCEEPCGIRRCASQLRNRIFLVFFPPGSRPGGRHTSHVGHHPASSSKRICPDRSSGAKSRIAACPQSANRVNFCHCRHEKHRYKTHNQWVQAVYSSGVPLLRFKFI